MSTEGAVAITIKRDAKGHAWISVDSLVEMLRDIASTTKDEVSKTLNMIADTFAANASFEIPEATGKVNVTTCRCGKQILSARRIEGATFACDVDPIPNGPWVPLQVRDGSYVVAPWSPKFDGIDMVRLREHRCKRKSA